ncbi:MAG TPA: hypothetical protein VJ738_11895 [Steroidobacteraceae bacterium]|nr:hypothetical protein [Steroidobacteraceae bacterium]
MKYRHLVPTSLLLLAAGMAGAALAHSPPAEGAKFHELDVSVGRWVYHGHFLAGAGAHPSPWTWHEDCRWSANRVFMLCSFSNTWAGRHVDSEVVDTYDPKADSFWHYEIFNTGRSAGKPFAVRMRIEGATRTETWTETHNGKSVHQRIVYKFASGGKVAVSFEQSADGAHWKTTASGTGEKTAAS